MYLCCTSKTRGTKLYFNFFLLLQIDTRCYSMLQIDTTKRMSSNIQIPKICNYCKQSFIAKTVLTRYCSHKCNSRDYKLQRRTEKIVVAQEKEFEKLAGIEMPLIQVKEFLSVKETCLLLGISRMSLHRYIKNKTIQPSKIGGRIIIKRQSINHLIS